MILVNFSYFYQLFKSQYFIQMRLPEKLKKGDKIAIVAAGKKISLDELSKAISYYENWGLEVYIGKSIDAEDNYFAGSDSLRKEDLQNVLDDPLIKAVCFARGGYGMVRIIDNIDFTIFNQKPKWLVGFSDVTVLHNHINKNTPTIHGIMPVFFDTATPSSIASVKAILFEHKMDYSFESPFTEFNRDGDIIAPIVGGNLSIIYALCGSASSLDTSGCILFIEDLSEYLYHIDRMMQNLKRNGMLQNLKGIIVGGFSDIKDGATPFAQSAESLLHQYVKDLNIPVFMGFPAGHINNNHALVFGEKVKMKVNGNKIHLQIVN